MSVRPYGRLGTNHTQGFPLVINLKKAVTHSKIPSSENLLHTRFQDSNSAQLHYLATSPYLQTNIGTFYNNSFNS